ncbi:MAG: hypothetical protein V3U73_08665, partial [bacterium]
MLSPIKPLGLILLIFLFAVLSGAREVPPAQDPLLELLTEELNREMTALQQQEAPPYFISYSVSDVHRTSVGASFGSLTNSSSSQSRLLSVNVRVGNYEFDNTHEIRGDPYSQFVFRSGGLVRIAQEDDPDAIRTALWRETNREYREAVERFNKVKANVAVKVREEDTSADFSLEPEPSTYYEPPVEVKALLGDRQTWEAKVKKYTEPFLENEEIYGGRASFSFTIERKNLVTSEGVKLAQNL